MPATTLDIIDQIRQTLDREEREYDGREDETDPRELAEDSDFALWVEAQYSRLVEVPKAA
jgi:hypothetical protein